jgi:IS1 family transposase
MEEIMNALPIEKQIQIARALVEGNSLRATARLCEIERKTVGRVLLRIGDRCGKLLNERMRGLRLSRLEFDEIWTFIAKKQKRVKPADPAEFGDQFVFVALDPASKLVPTFAVGKRDHATCWNFVNDVRQRTVGRVQVTTDGYKGYIPSIDDTFGADVDYAILIKSYGSSGEAGTPEGYHPPRVVGIFHQIMFGDPDPQKISTSYVERQNLTMRMAMRRFTRLTNAFSRKLIYLKAALSLHFAWYNFVRIHQSLRVTPAMEARLTSEVWTLADLLTTNTQRQAA